MRTLIIMVLLVLSVTALLNGCGGTQLADKFASEQLQQTQSQHSQLSSEDLMVAAMPSEERLAYLREKYKQLVWEFHGVRVEDIPNNRQASIGEDYAHKVAPTIAKEDMKLEQTQNKWEWRLSFLERLTGDYNHELAVSVADLTPLAMYFGAAPSMGATWLQAPYNIDRSANCDNVISIADVTPLAMNFGKELTGYDVYWQDYTGGDWRQIAA